MGLVLAQLMNRFLIAFLLLAVSAVAQTVRLANQSTVPFEGWKRTTIDQLPPHMSGKCNEHTRYVVGRKCGKQLYTVDVWCRLKSGEYQAFDLANATALAFELGEPPVDLATQFGGPVRLGGVAMESVDQQKDGAAFLLHYRQRAGQMFHVDLWVRWYPSQLTLAYGEAFVTCSNPELPELVADTPDLRLAFGDAQIVVAGLGLNKALVKTGTRFADGQARAVPFVLSWPQRVSHATQGASIGAANTFSIGAVGISKLLPDGNPHYDARFSAKQWAATRFTESLRRLHTWEGGTCGPAPFSGITGAQEDQVFVRGEPLLPDGVGAEWVVYLSALKLANRPCHFLEADGSIVDTENHPDCVMWSGRPHWHHGVSPDRLGKPKNITAADVSGDWSGADREHWLFNTVAAAARYTGSKAVQRILEHQAHMLLMSETIKPGLSTSSSDAARSIGWLGILVVHLDQNLENRTLAARVVERWRQKVLTIYLAQLSKSPGDWWDPRLDARLQLPAETWGVMTWQQSIGAYGLNLACRLVGPPQGQELALRAAKAVLAHAFTPEIGGKPISWAEYDALKDTSGVVWREWGNIAFRPGERMPVADYYSGAAAGLGAAGPRWFRTAWHPPVTHVVLEHEPDNQKALQVERQLWQSGAGGNRSWYPPKGPRKRAR